MTLDEDEYTKDEKRDRFDLLMAAIARAVPPYPHPLPVRRLTRQPADHEEHDRLPVAGSDTD